jgi:hypothetical protein
LDLAILNSYIILSSCVVKKISHRDFWLTPAGMGWSWATTIQACRDSSLDSNNLGNVSKGNW